MVLMLAIRGRMNLYKKKLKIHNNIFRYFPILKTKKEQTGFECALSVHVCLRYMISYMLHVVTCRTYKILF
jgi:hypothetical protein